MMKNAIRKTMLDLRSELNFDEKKLRDQHIIEQIESHEKFINAKTVAIFYPMKSEIDLLKLLTHDKIFLFPRVNKRKLDFLIYNEQTVFSKSGFGVLEPIGNNIYKSTIDLMLVPALAISPALDRIGYGKGYYDSYIRENDIKYKIGVIYDFQEVKEINSTSMDQKLDQYIKGSL